MSSLDVRRPVDRWLVFFAFILMVIGMIWVYSASSFRGATATTFLVRQMVAGLLGLGIMMVLSQLELRKLRENPKVLQVAYGVLLVALVAVFFFPPRNGAHRWIVVAGWQLQPSELLKPLLVMVTAWWMVRHQEVWNRKEEAIPKLVTLLGILAVPLALVLREPDFGTTFLILFVCMLVVFLGGAPRWIFAVLVPTLVAVGVAFVVSKPYRLSRVTSFLNPEADPLGKGHQALQSLIALGNGGWKGVGVGQSMQKLNYLPEAHTDFIFAVIGEEAGLIGTMLVVLLFFGILWRGFRLARRLKDSFLRLCCIGFTLLLTVQAMMNMSVVLSLVPNKGIPLPFISYGGTSLMASLVVLGLLLAISKEASA